MEGNAKIIVGVFAIAIILMILLIFPQYFPNMPWTEPTSTCIKSFGYYPDDDPYSPPELMKGSCECIEPDIWHQVVTTGDTTWYCNLPSNPRECDTLEHVALDAISSCTCTGTWREDELGSVPTLQCV